MATRDIPTTCGCGTYGPLQKIMRRHDTPEGFHCHIDQNQRQG